MIEGTPAITMTLPSQKTGAAEILFSSSNGALRDPRHAQACLVELHRRRPGAEDLDHARVDVDRHAERLSDAVGGDVVVGRADPAGREHVSRSVGAARSAPR